MHQQAALLTLYMIINDSKTEIYTNLSEMLINGGLSNLFCEGSIWNGIGISQRILYFSVLTGPVTGYMVDKVKSRMGQVITE